jgi:hypothetical protein
LGTSRPSIEGTSTSSSPYGLREAHCIQSAGISLNTAEGMRLTCQP